MSLLFPDFPLIEAMDFFETFAWDLEEKEKYEVYTEPLDTHRIYAIPGFFSLPLVGRLMLAAFGKRPPHEYTQATRWQDEISQRRLFNPLNYIALGMNALLSTFQYFLIRAYQKGFDRYKTYNYRIYPTVDFNLERCKLKHSEIRSKMQKFLREKNYFKVNEFDSLNPPSLKQRFQSVFFFGLPGVGLCLLSLLSMCVDAVLAPAFAIDTNIDYIKQCTVHFFKRPLKSLASWACAAGLSYLIFVHLALPLIATLPLHALLSAKAIMTIGALAALFLVACHAVVSCSRIACDELLPLLRKSFQDIRLLERKARLMVIKGNGNIKWRTDTFVDPKRKPSYVSAQSVLNVLHWYQPVVDVRKLDRSQKETNIALKNEFRQTYREVDERAQQCYDKLPEALNTITCFWSPHKTPAAVREPGATHTPPNAQHTEMVMQVYNPHDAGNVWLNPRPPAPPNDLFNFAHPTKPRPRIKKSFNITPTPTNPIFKLKDATEPPPIDLYPSYSLKLTEHYV